jgi:proton glutamate symport protein
MMQLYTKILIGMGLGVGLGFLVGPNSAILSQDAVRLSGVSLVRMPGSLEVVPLSLGVRHAKLLEERAVVVQGKAQTWLHVRWTLSAKDLLHMKSEKKRAKKAAKEAFIDNRAGLISAEKLASVQSLAASLAGLGDAKSGSVHEGWVLENDVKTMRYASLGQHLIDATEWIGLLFLAMIKMVVVPLVFCSLLVGVASLGDFRKLGRLGGRTIGFFFATTVVALTIGVGLANLIAPGTLLSESDRMRLLASYSDGASSTVANAAQAPSFSEQIVGIVPTNPIASMANGEMLQIIFFALMLGIALTLMDPKKARSVVELTDRINEAMVMLVHIAMKLAPVGVAALLFKVAGTTGVSVLLALAAYGGVVLLGLSIHLCFTYGGVLRFGARLSFWGFLGAIREALLLAFSTSSSSATLPVTMRCCEERVGIKRETTSFVLPLGATVNMDGTALYQGVAALFIAQIYGMDLSLGEQITIVASATMASIGAAGVPGAGMITLAMVLTAVGVPTEGLALVLGVDRLLDMFRTAVNVVGDSTACAFMARLEGEKLQLMSAAEDQADPSKGFEGRLDHEPSSVGPAKSDAAEG